MTQNQNSSGTSTLDLPARTPLRDGTSKAERMSYSDVAFYRKKWMMVTLFFLFIPAMILLCLSGSIYQNSNGSAQQWEEKQRYSWAAGGAIFMAIGIMQMLAASATGG